MKNFQFLILLFFQPFICSGQFGSEQAIIKSDTKNPRSIETFDLDNDENMDALFALKQENQIVWIRNEDGLGTFSDQKIISNFVDDPTAVTAGDLDGDGDLDIVSASDDDSKIAWYENEDGLGNFGPQQIISATIRGVNLINLIDLDNDGDLDVITPSTRDDKLVWFRNENGLGNFSEEQVIDNGKRFNQAYATDINGDGYLDILSASDTNVAWYENEDGGGDFGEEQEIGTALYGFKLIFPDDLDNDGDVDFLAFGNDADGEYDSFRWYKNLDGSGNFEKQFDKEDSSLNFIKTMDVDNDGDRDLITENYTGLRWFENKLAELDRFEGSEPLVSFREPSSLGIADFDNDNQLDLLIASSNEDKISWFKSIDGQGTFDIEQSITKQITPEQPVDIRLGDIDGDDQLDLVVSYNEGSSNPKVVWYRNEDGLTDFGPEQIIHTHQFYAPTEFELADIDNDGDLDLVCDTYSNDEIYWYENEDGLGSFSDKKVITNLVDLALSIELVDLDNDGDLDILTGDRDGASVLWIENLGASTFGPTQEIGGFVETIWTSVIIAEDIDNDGDLDVLSSSKNSSTSNPIGKVVWYENEDGLGNFGPEQIILNTSSNWVKAADMDNDNDLDVLCRESGKTVWYENEDGQGSFNERKIISTLEELGDLDIELVDVDLDQDLDVVFGNVVSEEILWKENLDGFGNFSEEEPVLDNNISLRDIEAVDLDNDGDLDIVGANFSDDEIILFQNFLGTSTITGKYFWDKNENGLFDTDELPLENQQIILEPTIRSTWTNEEGIYQFKLTPGIYNFSYPITSGWVTTTDNTDVVIDELGAQGVRNIGIAPIEEELKIEANISSGPTRCGFDVPFWLQVVNLGTHITDAVVTFTLDPLVTYISANPEPFSIDGNTLIWKISDLSPFLSQKIHLNLQMPGVDEIGNKIKIDMLTLLVDENESILSSELDTYQSIINCAYDPNDKLVFPDFEGDQNYALIDEPLSYTIRFQNTGTDTAFNVIIKDQLDPNLDWSTFRPIAGSHSFQTNLHESGLVEFQFRNILLPDSTTNEIASHGFIKYQVQAKAGIDEKTIIENTADIIFDFNEAIITNTTENIMLSTFDADEDGFNFYEDCDDTNAEVNTAATEIPYNGLDDDCNAQTLDDDLDQDGFALSEDCDDTNAEVNSAAAEIPYNGLDDDCNAQTLDDDLDQDGFIFSEDCDDTNAEINDNAEEIPNNGIDEDCNGEDLIMTNRNDLNHQALQISPNPTTGLLNIILLEIESANLEVRGLNGQILLHQNITVETKLNLSELPDGIYLIIIQSKDKVWIERVIKI